MSLLFDLFPSITAFLQFWLPEIPFWRLGAPPGKNDNNNSNENKDHDTDDDSDTETKKASKRYEKFRRSKIIQKRSETAPEQEGTPIWKRLDNNLNTVSRLNPKSKKKQYGIFSCPSWLVLHSRTTRYLQTRGYIYPEIPRLQSFCQGDLHFDHESIFVQNRALWWTKFCNHRRKRCLHVHLSMLCFMQLTLSMHLEFHFNHLNCVHP